MKLPQEVDIKIAALQFDMEAFEAIVRDCAKVADDPEVPYAAVAQAILARYSLEPK